MDKRDFHLRCPAHIATVAFNHQTPADSFPAFQRIAFPTEVYLGVNPKMHTLEQDEYLVGQIRDCELVVLEESGHVPMWEESGRFNRELLTFSRRVFTECS